MAPTAATARARRRRGGCSRWSSPAPAALLLAFGWSVAAAAGASSGSLQPRPGWSGGGADRGWGTASEGASDDPSRSLLSFPDATVRRADDRFDESYRAFDPSFLGDDSSSDDLDGEADDPEGEGFEPPEAPLLRSLSRRRRMSALSLPWVRRGLLFDENCALPERDNAKGGADAIITRRHPPLTLRSTGTTIAGVVVVLDDDEEEEEEGDPPRDGIGGGGGGGSGFNDDECGGIDVSVQRKKRGRRRKMAVVLGSDTRATAGSLVADKNASKIHPLASNLYACGAGTSADLLHLARQARYTLRYVRQCQFESVGNPNATTYARRSSDGDDPDGDDGGDDDPDVFVNVPAACRWLQDTLYSRGGSCQANLIVGGVTEEGDAVLRAIHPHGSMDEDLPYAALGSGGLAAMSVLESRYRPRMGLDEAVRLVKDAVAAGIRNDLGSGSAIDLCVLDSRAPPSAPAAHARSAVPEEDPYPPRRPEPRLNELPRDPPPHAGEASGDSTEIRAGMLEGQDESEAGVNGFGNVPIRIRSVRTVQRFGDEERLESDWDEILGLSPPPTE